MSLYVPPVDEMQFLLHDVLGFSHPAFGPEMTEAIFGEAARLASEVLAPLNQVGDRQGALLEAGKVRTATGFKDAYRQYCAGGWNAIPFDPAYGGQGVPWAVCFPVQEMWQGANMAFGLCPLLNQGAVEAIAHHGSEEQKAYYLPRLISGEWTGTMNLTESQAGSDLGLIRTRARSIGDGAYAITGQKIFITYGAHDMAENIIHLVLARLPDAPEDVRGISLFIVPQVLEDGTRNTLECIGLEHKLGIHASPTCTMAFSDAKGFLVGEAHMGLKYMFTMMNNARLSVGLQGVAIAERATQHAQEYAQNRLQGKAMTGGDTRVPIARHADVKRMLLTMRALTQAGRALAYEAALALDAKDQARVEVMTPIVKGWCTDMAQEVASLGVQVHGGMGFIEETGSAQYLRDARILPIYEGTNGIQALDLVFRKTLKDGGAQVRVYMAVMKARIGSADHALFAPYFAALEGAVSAVLQAGQAQNLELAQAMASPFLKGVGLVAGGALLSASVEALHGRADEFAQDKRRTASFFAGNILPFALGHFHSVMYGARAVL